MNLFETLSKEKRELIYLWIWNNLSEEQREKQTKLIKEAFEKISS